MSTTENTEEKEQDIVVQGVHNYSAAETYCRPEEPILQEKLEWFQDQKLALMMHFGPYAQMGICESWPLSEEDASWSRRDVDWEDDPKVFREQYVNLNRSFNPMRFVPEQWADVGARDGFKYFLLTTKHHEGFCMWDTQYTDYKCTNTPAGRDLVREYVDAFRAEGLRVGFYYSLIDWHHPDFPIDMLHPRRDDPDAYEQNQGRDMRRYAEYMRNQVTELLTNYGKIDILWFDFSYPDNEVPEKTPWMRGKGKDDWEAEKLIALARSLQPHIMIDNRTGIEQDLWTPEQFQPTECIVYLTVFQNIFLAFCQVNQSQQRFCKLFLL